MVAAYDYRPRNLKHIVGFPNDSAVITYQASFEMHEAARRLLAGLPPFTFAQRRGMSEAILEALCTTFDLLGVAVVILSSAGRVLFANKPAKAMMDKGWPIRMADGFLQGKDRETTAELRQALKLLGSGQQSAEARDYELCLAQSPAGQPGAIGCLRLLASGGNPEPAIALFITETGQTSQYGIDGLAEAYGLSKAETRVLSVFVEAQTPAETAARLNIAVSTVKSHIRKIFNKTNTSRQAELLLLIECCRTPFRKIDGGRE